MALSILTSHTSRAGLNSSGPEGHTPECKSYTSGEGSRIRKME